MVRELRLAPVACCTLVAAPDITSEQADALAAIFKALAHPRRVRIVNLLANTAEPVCVYDFMAVAMDRVITSLHRGLAALASSRT